MHILWGCAQGQLGRSTDDEVIALANRFVPIGAKGLMAQPFETLIQGDDKKQEKSNIRHAAHSGDIGFADKA